MRTLSAAAQAKFNSQYGVEPISVIEVQWVENGPRHTYVDRDVDGVGIGRIIDLSNLDFIVNINDGSDSAEITVVLSDVDGHIKSILDNNDIHKRDVWVYQWADGLDISDKFLVFRGEINSPIEWDERDRTLKFNVITKIEDAEVGFSIEEGVFPAPDPELIGKAWPLKFGTTINVPALRVQPPTKGILSTGVGIMDPSLPYRLEAAKRITCPQVLRGYSMKWTEFGVAGGGILNIIPNYSADKGCAQRRCEAIANLRTQIIEQKKYEFVRIKIIDGEKFPQGTTITLDIDGAQFTGHFEGTPSSPSNIFAISSRHHPDGSFANALEEAEESIREREDFVRNKNCRFGSGGSNDGYGGLTTGFDSQSDISRDESRTRVEESADSWEFYNAVEKSSFFWAKPGATVTLANSEPIVYISNLLPETIHTVSAFRQFELGRQLVVVPTTYYTQRFSDFGTYTVSEIVLDRPLSRIADGWEDDIYVTSTSSVGPNTVDIISWLITKYTSYGIDAASFASVRASVSAYPSDFPLLERKNIITVLQEIAFQARCSIYLRDNTFYLKYLPARPDAVTTITEDDVDSGTLQLFHTDTEEIVTKLIANWKRDYSKTEDNKIILRHNIKKYGTQEQDFEFYIYNELDYVHKSATFWLIRKSNTWRKLRFNTPVHEISVETLDGINIDLDVFSPNTIRAWVTKADFDSENHTIQFEVWTPVKSGTQEEYDFAHPATLNPILVWPTDEERALLLAGSGDAPGFSAAPPSGHTLSDGGGAGGRPTVSFGPCASQGRTTQSFVRQTCGGGDGDTYPSDVEDTQKPKDLVGEAPPGNPTDVSVINIGDTAIPDIHECNIDELCQRVADLERDLMKAMAEALAANQAAGGRGSGQEDCEPDPFDKLPEEPPAGKCQFRTVIFIKEPTVLFKTGEIGSTDTGFVGDASLIRTDTLYFNTCCEAQQMAIAIINMHNQHQQNEDYQKQQQYPMNAVSVCPICADEPAPLVENGAVPPTPIAWESVSAEPTNEDGSQKERGDDGSPNDFMEDVMEFWDAQACVPVEGTNGSEEEESEEEESEEGKGEGDEEMPEGVEIEPGPSSAPESTPAGPDTDGDGAADEPWTPGDCPPAEGSEE